MGHSIYYVLARATPLEPDELARLAEHVGRWRLRIKDYGLNVAPAPGRTGVVAFGWVKTSYDGARIERTLAAVTELRGTVPGTTAAVSDDLELIRWDGASYTLDVGEADDDLALPPDQVEWPALVPTRPARAPAAKKPRTPRAKAAAAAPAPPPPPPPEPSQDERIDALLDAAAREDDEASTTLGTLPAARVAARGLARFRALGRTSCAAGAIGRAVKAAADTIADDTLAEAARIALAEAGPSSAHGYALEPVADREPVLVPMLAALARAGARGEVVTAARLLGYAAGASDRAVPCLAARARADRGQRRDWHAPVLGALGWLGRPAALPTLLLELAGDEESASQTSALSAVVQCGVELDDRWRARVLACARAAEWLADHLFRTPGRVSAVVLEHDDWRVRRKAALALRDPARVAALWRDVDAAYPWLVTPLRADDASSMRDPGPLPATPALPSLIEAATSPAHDLRVWALAELHARCQPDELLACGLAGELDAALVRLGHARVERAWADWRKAIPGLPKDNRERPPWIREHAATVAPQRLTPALERILADGADAVAAAWLPPRLVLTDDERRELDAHEQALVAQATS